MAIVELGGAAMEMRATRTHANPRGTKVARRAFRCGIVWQCNYVEREVRMAILNNESGTYAAHIVQDALGAPGMPADFKAIYDKSETSGQFSFEERMGCGFGACMGCSCKTKYGNKRICRDGPVLEKEEIIW